ncbi:MAG TPA: hypothetical protein VN778_05470 [Verrucomicrobiae bacterium]|nr:hypothetical protein [Verrucomicrobiae bacterium]
MYLYSPKMVTVQIPMERELRDALKRKALHLGFNSIQSFVRFWAQAEIEGRKVNLDDALWEPDIYKIKDVPE